MDTLRKLGDTQKCRLVLASRLSDMSIEYFKVQCILTKKIRIQESLSPFQAIPWFEFCIQNSILYA